LSSKRAVRVGRGATPTGMSEREGWSRADSYTSMSERGDLVGGAPVASGVRHSSVSVASGGCFVGRVRFVCAGPNQYRKVSDRR
jgi:hypothetical protein